MLKTEHCQIIDGLLRLGQDKINSLASAEKELVLQLKALSSSSSKIEEGGMQKM